MVFISKWLECKNDLYSITYLKESKFQKNDNKIRLKFNCTFQWNHYLLKKEKEKRMKLIWYRFFFFFFFGIFLACKWLELFWMVVCRSLFESIISQFTIHIPFFLVCVCVVYVVYLIEMRRFRSVTLLL